MSLKLNLYHEIEAESLARQRDPFKIAALVGIIIAMILLGYYSVKLGETNGVQSRANAMKKELDKLKAQAVEAKKREEELIKQGKVNQVLLDRIQGRFYWAPFLQLLAEVVPKQIQLTGFSSTIEKRRAGECIISGLAAGTEPRAVAEQFRLDLQKRLSEKFVEVVVRFDANSLEDSNQIVNLDGQSLPTVTFRIRAQFRTEPTPTPTPTPAKKARAR